MNYVVRHNAVLRRMLQVGVPVTFTKETPGAYNASADTYSTPTTSSVVGRGVQLCDDAIELRAAGLTVGESVTILFIPDTIGDEPELLSQLTWHGLVRTVRLMHPFRPDGNSIGTKVVLS